MADSSAAATCIEDDVTIQHARDNSRRLGVVDV